MSLTNFKLQSLKDQINAEAVEQAKKSEEEKQKGRNKKVKKTENE